MTNYYDTFRFDSILAEDDDEMDFRFDDESCEDGIVESTFVLRGKWMLEGATTLADAAEMARAYADLLDDLAISGYELNGRVEDDYGLAIYKSEIN